VNGLRMKGAQWVAPKLTARVRHLAGAKYLRHAVVKAAGIAHPIRVASALNTRVRFRTRTRSMLFCSAHQLS
jgi:hypothetical protein